MPASLGGEPDAGSAPGDGATGSRAAVDHAAVAAPPVDRAFFARDAEAVARDLLGMVICRAIGGQVRKARLVEVEAYVGPRDLACHTSRGRTARTEVMFGPAGHAYVYLVYGLHFMLNVVTGHGDGQAVLLRAAEPLAGLCGCLDGPAKLTRALGIDKSHNGCDLIGATLRLEPGQPPERVTVTARIGVDYAGQWAAAPLRFLDAGSRCVSRLRAADRQDRVRYAGRAATRGADPRPT